MTPLYLLTDYKNRFGSKWKSTPYRGGFDKDRLAEALAAHGLLAEFIPCAQVFPLDRSWRRRIVLYTSIEERGNHYKGFLEDVVFGLEQAGACVLPRPAFLRANNNKVFMEMLREAALGADLTGLKSVCFGTYEELREAVQRKAIPLPCVLKPAYGAMSRGVSCARSEEELYRQALRLSRTPQYLHEIKEFLRSRRQRYRGYAPESRHQGKFIVQSMIENLDGDWKVLVYGDQYYVLKRHVRPGDFRASGSHVNYLAGSQSGIPVAVLDMVETVYRRLDVPHLSVDVAFDGTRPRLLEFQAVHFGTSTQAEFSTDYYTKHEGEWRVLAKSMDQEAVYAWGIAHFLKRHPEIGCT